MVCLKCQVCIDCKLNPRIRKGVKLKDKRISLMRSNNTRCKRKLSNRLKKLSFRCSEVKVPKIVQKREASSKLSSKLISDFLLSAKSMIQVRLLEVLSILLTSRVSISKHMYQLQIRSIEQVLFLVKHYMRKSRYH